MNTFLPSRVSGGGPVDPRLPGRSGQRRQEGGHILQFFSPPEREREGERERERVEGERGRERERERERSGSRGKRRPNRGVVSSPALFQRGTDAVGAKVLEAEKIAHVLIARLVPHAAAELAPPIEYGLPLPSAKSRRVANRRALERWGLFGPKGILFVLGAVVLAGSSFSTQFPAGWAL